MVHVEDVLLWAISDTGATYVFGAEASIRDDHPTRIDCSELVEWSCGKAGVLPVMPDGSYNQFAHCQRHNTVLSVDRALRTRGALMFITESTGVIGHVVFSLGDGTTMEAKGKAYGVGTFTAYRPDGKPRFDKAGLIPGVDYFTPRPRLPEDDMFEKEDRELLQAIKAWIDKMENGVPLRGVEPLPVSTSQAHRNTKKIAAKLGITDAE